MSILSSKIAAIFAAHQLPAPQKITPLVGGMVNPIFNVDDRAIIRFNQRDPHIRKFAREAEAYRLLAGHVPLPELLVYDNAQTIVPCEYLILSRLPGLSLHASWDALSRTDKSAAAYSAGQWLAAIHSADAGSGFGRLEARTYASWTRYLEDYLQRNLRKASEFGAVNANEVAQIEAIFSAADWLDTIQQPSLLHGDYWFHNIHYHNGHISGIYDFEWSLAGDPAFDLKDTLYLEDYNVGSQQPFLEGYQSIRPMPDRAEQKQLLYLLLYQVELTPVAWEHWGTERFADIKNDLIQLIKQNI